MRNWKEASFQSAPLPGVKAAQRRTEHPRPESGACGLIGVRKKARLLVQANDIMFWVKLFISRKLVQASVLVAAARGQTAAPVASPLILTFAPPFGRIFALSLMLPICLLAAAFLDYPVREVGDYAISAEKAGVAIGLQPVEDVKEQTNYFHMELGPRGVLPVFIVLQNRSKSDSFIFDKTSLTYGPAESSASTPQAKVGDGMVLVRALSRMSLWNKSTGILANPSSVQENFLKKEMRSGALSPGASTHGFLYFPAPKKDARQKMCLRVPVTKVAGKTAFIDLVF